MTKASRMRLLAILRSLVKLGQSWVELYRESLMDSAQPLSGSSAEAPAWYSNKNSNLVTARWTMGRGKRPRFLSCSLSASHRPLRAIIFSSS